MTGRKQCLPFLLVIALAYADLAVFSAISSSFHRLDSADIAASFQEAVVDVLVAKLFMAARREGATRIAISGGVAANSRLREVISQRAEAQGYTFYVPPIRLCTDNAAVVAGVAHGALSRGEASSLSFDTYARK